MNKFLKISLSVMVWSFVIAVPVSAQLPQGVPITLGEVEGLFNDVAQSILYIGVVIAVITIVWAGITYMSAGSDTTKVGAARQRLVTGMIGALIVLGVGVILRTVDAIITRDFFI